MTSDIDAPGDMIDQIEDVLLPYTPYPVRAAAKPLPVHDSVSAALQGTDLFSPRHSVYRSLEASSISDGLARAKHNADHQTISEAVAAIDQLRWSSGKSATFELTEPLHHALRHTDLDPDYPARFLWSEHRSIYCHLPASGRELVHLQSPAGNGAPLLGFYLNFLTIDRPVSALSHAELDAFEIQTNYPAIGVEMNFVAGAADDIDTYPTFMAMAYYAQDPNTRVGTLRNAIMRSAPLDPWLNLGQEQDDTQLNEALDLALNAIVYLSLPLENQSTVTRLPNMPLPVNAVTPSQFEGVERIGPESSEFMISKPSLDPDKVLRLERGSISSMVNDDGEEETAWDYPRLVA